MRRFLTAASLAAVLTGCGDGGSTTASGVATVVDTTAGVVHTGNSGEAPVWEAVPVVRLGSMDGGPQEFGRIRSVIADGAGLIYVADNLASEIRVFTPQGDHVRSIGRQGGGPGEFGDLYGLAWLDGNIAAMDPRNARIAILSPAGEWIEGIRYFPITGPPSLIRLYPLGNAGFYAPIIAPQAQRLPFVRMTAAGPADTIPAPQQQAGAQQTGVVCHRPDGGITGITVPQGPGLVHAFPPPGGAIAVSWTESYRIAFLDTQGDTVRVVSRDQPPLAYPDALWAEAMQPYDELREQFPGTQCEPSAPERPALSRRPAAYRVRRQRCHVGRGGRRGRLRVGRFRQRRPPDRSAPAPPRAAAIPPYVRGGHLYQVETDELDVQHVAVYRLGQRQPT
jgi:hypothetical protein